MRRVLCFGDSNTFGTGPMARLGEGPIHDKATRWPGVMAEDLGEQYDVVVEGLPGRTTVFDDPVEGEYRNGLRSMRAILESHRPIDLLILKLGTNDTKQRFGLGPRDIALGVARLLAEARQLQIIDQMLVICPAPVKERGDLAEIFRGAAARCVGLPGEIERFSRQNGAEFLDAGKHIEADELDGVHLSAASHKVLGHVVAKKVREIFE